MGLGFSTWLEHVWNGYAQWGVANPEQQKVLKQIQVWGGLAEA
jgi:hypothetical protein